MSHRCHSEEEDDFDILKILQKHGEWGIALFHMLIPTIFIYYNLHRFNPPWKRVFGKFVMFFLSTGLLHVFNAERLSTDYTFNMMVAHMGFSLVSVIATIQLAVTLRRLIPLLLRVKERELFLSKRELELRQAVKFMNKHKEMDLQLLMLIQKIRNSAERDTILHTTLVELSHTLSLQNCAIWLPSEGRTELVLTNQLRGSNGHVSLPYDHPEVLEIEESKEVNILRSESSIRAASSDDAQEIGPVAATSIHHSQICFGILVLVLPSDHVRAWTCHELEIVKVVADHVAVALSHATVIEESCLMTQRLSEQNMALQRAWSDALRENQARNSYVMAVCIEMRRLTESILASLAIMQRNVLATDLQLLMDTMLNTGTIISTLIEDAINICTQDSLSFSLELRSFRLLSLIKEAACLTKCLCISRGFTFSIRVGNTLPDRLMGDEKRVLQVLLHLVACLLHVWDPVRGSVTLGISLVGDSEGIDDQRCASWRPTPSDDGFIYVKFEFGVHSGNSRLCGMISSPQLDGGLNFNMCEKLIRMMQGNVWFVANSRGLLHHIIIILKFQLHPVIELPSSER